MNTVLQILHDCPGRNVAFSHRLIKFVSKHDVAFSQQAPKTNSVKIFTDTKHCEILVLDTLTSLRSVEINENFSDSVVSDARSSEWR